MKQFDLSNMPPACKTIGYTSKSWYLAASNEQYLLMHRLPDLCLVDRNFEIVRQTTTNYTEIRSICWSSSLDRFIIVSEKDVFSIDDKAMSINTFPKLSKGNWLTCTCSDTSLFLSAYTCATSIAEYHLLPSIEVTREWKTPVTCKGDEWVNDMKYCNGSMALLIMNTSKNTVFIELRSSNTLDQLWSCPTDCKNLQNKAFHCCLLTNHEWLIMGPDSDHLVHITKDGKMKPSNVYKPSPNCATMFGLNTIAISTTKGLNFHNI